ncbi:hypothetical protein B0H12DRAFT_1148028, partial [Mycena haematopus]
DPPTGFLFLCPEEDIRIGPSSFRWPECAAYWCLDPFGVDRLTALEATRLGFPSLQLTATATGDSWDASVYDGLRQFHLAKGFDPESQDLARHLGWPIYQLSGELDAPCAHLDGETFGVDSDDSGAANPTDDESEYPPTSLEEDIDDELLDLEEDRTVHKNCGQSERTETSNREQDYPSTSNPTVGKPRFTKKLPRPQQHSNS